MGCAPPTAASVADRVAEAVAVARRLLEDGGPDALSMRAIAAEMGIRAPSLYKHIADKATLEVELIAAGLREFGQELQDHGRDLTQMAGAYRRWALEHPHLYLLVTQRPLPRDRLPAGLEASVARPVIDLAGDADVARALWASA